MPSTINVMKHNLNQIIKLAKTQNATPGQLYLKLYGLFYYYDRVDCKRNNEDPDDPDFMDPESGYVSFVDSRFCIGRDGEILVRDTDRHPKRKATNADFVTACKQIQVNLVNTILGRLMKGVDGGPQ